VYVCVCNNGIQTLFSLEAKLMLFPTPIPETQHTTTTPVESHLPSQLQSTTQLKPS